MPRKCQADTLSQLRDPDSSRKQQTMRVFEVFKVERGTKKQLQEVIPALRGCLSTEPLLMTIFPIKPSSAQHGQFAQFPRDTLLTVIEFVTAC